MHRPIARTAVHARVAAFVFSLIGLPTGCAPLPSGSAGAAAPPARRDERVLVGGMAVIDAVAVSRRFVFAAGTGGVLVYDRLAERFVPSSADLDHELGRDGAVAVGGARDLAPLGAPPVTAIAGDPVEDALWIGIPGAVLSYRPFTQQVQRTIVTGVPQRIVFDRSGTGDALVQVGGVWTRVSRLGLASPVSAPSASQVIAPPTLGELLTRYPTLRAQPQLLLRQQAPNRPRSQFALLSVAASPDRASELWLGTDGDGLFRLDPVFGQGAALPYGLLDPGAGAIAPAVNGVWVAGLGLSVRRGGLTFATFDLQRWRWIEGTITVPLAGVRTFALTTRGARAYLGTDRGLVRVQLDGAQDMQLFTRLRGLPDDRVFAVAARERGVWAGTARGLVFVDDSLSAGEPLLRDVAVYALQSTGTALWAGTQRGLVRLAADGGQALGTVADAPRAVVAGELSLRAPVRALAASDSVLLVATDDAVVQLDPRGDALPATGTRLPMLEPRRVGEVTRLAADDKAYALAGRDGVVLWSRRTGAHRELRVPADVPGAVFDVLWQREYLFLATAQGMVRYRRTADGIVP